MHRSDLLPAALLLLACALITWGVSRWSEAAAYIVGGVLLALWAVFFTMDAPAGGER